MRESRAYGSVRGACDETHVPTATLTQRVVLGLGSMNPIDLIRQATRPALPANIPARWLFRSRSRPVRVQTLLSDR
jgi:hypothetical protein